MHIARYDHFSIAADNREPWHRSHVAIYGIAEWWVADAGEIQTAPGTIAKWTPEPRYVFPGLLETLPKCAGNAVFLVDDGRTVRPFYVTGWSPLDNEKAPETRGNVSAQPFPVNYGPDGEVRQRADGTGPVDFSTWQLGPHTAYHVKVTLRETVAPEVTA